jgi:Inner membrane protein YgaP-like, transmembrane domain
MNANVGGVDRVLRIVVGLALIAWAVLGGPVWAWIGVIPLATGVVRWCPVYLPLGLSTRPKGSE